MATSIKRPRPSLTRNNLREAVYKKLPHISRDESKRLTDEVFEEIILALLENDKVKLRSFGQFKIHHKKERSGSNPKTLKEAVITARRSVKFIASPFLKAIVNGEDTSNLKDDEE